MYNIFDILGYTQIQGTQYDSMDADEVSEVCKDRFRKFTL